MSMTTFSRFAGAAALGAVITGGVVLLMQLLIDSDQPPPDEPPRGATLTFLPRIEEHPPVPHDRKLPPPPEEVFPPPPPPPKVTADPFAATRGAEFTPPPVAEPTGPNLAGPADGDALPVVKVRPAYPARAQQRGIEGYVLVQFTIDRLGRVRDVQVLEAEPRGVFEQAAVKAVERFRYKPRVVNGEPTPVSGVQHRVTFELTS